MTRSRTGTPCHLDPPRSTVTEAVDDMQRAPDQLRLAAGLLEKRKPELAYRIADRVVTELGAALALAEMRR